MPQSGEKNGEMFVVAVKRECRTRVPPDWIEVVRGTPGVTIVGDANPHRVQVHASPEAIQQMRGEFLRRIDALR